MIEAFSCYLCNSANLEIIKKGIRDNKDINVYKCIECELIFLSQFLSKEYYKQDNLPTKEDTMLYIDTERRFNEYKEVFRNKKILDFGCGSGEFLKKLKNNKITNFFCVVEPNEKYCYNLMTNFIWYSDTNNIPNNTFDYITLFHVLEHLKDPINILKQLKEKLNDNGQIIIEVPNVNEALSNLYFSDSYINHKYIPWHLFYFNRNTLKKVIEKAGLKVEFIKGIQRYSLSNHLYWLANNRPEGHLVWAFLNDKILDSIYTSKLAELDMNDTLYALVSKNSQILRLEALRDTNSKSA